MSDTLPRTEHADPRTLEEQVSRLGQLDSARVAIEEPDAEGRPHECKLE